MSAVDHINTILKILPTFSTKEEALYSLANAFYDAARNLEVSDIY